MAGRIELFERRDGGWRTRFCGEAGDVTNRGWFGSREAALADARRVVAERAPQPAQPIRGEAVASFGRVTERPQPAAATKADLDGLVEQLLARPDIRAGLERYQHSRETAALREEVRRRVGPQLGEATSPVGVFLEAALEEIVARSTGVLRENAPLPRAATSFPERVQNTDVDWLVAQATERTAHRLAAVQAAFPGRP